MNLRGGVGAALVGAALVVTSCRGDEPSTPELAPAVTRVTEIRTRFGLAAAEARFEQDDHGRLRAATEGTASRPARVVLPGRADGEVEVADATSGVSVRFALEDAQGSPVEVGAGMAIYRRAVAGANLVHRIHAEGTEDSVLFEQRPARAELAYRVDVSRFAGIRLVSNTFELLDAGGTPLLRVAPPFAVEATGTRRPAELAVSGCAYDADPRGPWGRAVTPPGAPTCRLRVTWPTDVVYPLLVDPAWGTTGSLGVARGYHSATTLGSGKVLVAGGLDAANVSTASAELFDPAGNGGAGTFAATGTMTAPRGYFHGATLLASGKVLFSGGGSFQAPINTSDVYDPGTGTFTAGGSMTTKRYGHTASRLPSGKVLVAGGNDFSVGINDFVYLKSVEIFDPAGNGGLGTFSAGPDMISIRAYQSAVVLPSGKVLLAGGYDSNVISATAEIFDEAANGGGGGFTATGNLGTARHYFTASLLPSGRVLVAGGNGPVADNRLASAEIFDPAGNGGVGTFSATGPLATARDFHAAAVLPSGKVLVTGGWAGGPSFLSAEIFDPAGNGGQGTFASAGDMGARRGWHTMNTLGSGAVLVAAGYGNGMYLSSAELFSLQAAGAVCTADGQCQSGGCNGGYCCAGACAGSCRACAAGTGACAVVSNADDPDTCLGVNTCDASGECKRRNGTVCPGSDADCASGHCVDGVCCDTACGGGCDVCSTVLGASANGVCTPIGAGKAGSPACANGLLCNGTSASCPSACNKDADCAAGLYCDAQGACAAKKAKGGACDPAADCKAPGCHSCETGNCADGVCCDTPCNGPCEACALVHKTSQSQSGTCGAALACTTATCKDDHTAVASGGAVEACGAYRCRSGACLHRCATLDDCIAPAQCGPTGECVASNASSSDASSGDSGGCAVARAHGGGSSSRAWLLVCLGLAATLARRRR